MVAGTIERSLVAVIQRYLQAVAAQGIPVQCGVLYGSQATGSTHEWSDIDLLVVSPRFDRPYGREETHRLWRTAARIDSRIEPIPVGKRQWEEETGSALLEMARRTGILVEPVGERLENLGPA